MNDFDKAFTFIMRWEGGYVNHPNDPGGETKYGISKRSYPNLDIKNLTLQQAKEIYHKDYWRRGHCHQLPDSDTKIIHFDACVNSGTHAAMKFLQLAAGVDDDGVWGPQTHGAVWEGEDLSDDMLVHRMMYITNIVSSAPSRAIFLKGWFRRIIDLRKYTL